MDYDIFISYRREGGFDTAKHLYDLLVRDGYTVSFDIDTLRSGKFDTQLLSRIDNCKDFILIVDGHAFDRSLDPKFNPENDWLRKELAYALKKGKNIIPIFLADVNGFPKNLPADIAEVTKMHGPEYNRYYFNDFYKRLKDSFLQSKKKSSSKKFFGIIAIIAIIAGVVAIISSNNQSTYEYDYYDTSDTITDAVAATESPAIEEDNSLHFTYRDIPINLSIEDFSDRLIARGYSLIERNNIDHYYRFTKSNSDVKVYWIEQLDKVFMVEDKNTGFSLSENQDDIESVAYMFQDEFGREVVDISEVTKGFEFEYGFIEFDEEDDHPIMRYYDSENYAKYREL